MMHHALRALLFVLTFSLFVASLSLAQKASPATPAALPAVKPAAPAKEACLACHGPFDKLVTATGNYVWPKGEKHSPHMYVRHNTKNIPECTYCHKAHAMPPTPAGTAAMGKANPEYCFTCHHTEKLECGMCHEAK